MTLSSHRADLRRNVVTAIRVGLTSDQILKAVPDATPQLIKLMADNLRKNRERTRVNQERRNEKRRQATIARRADGLGMEHHALGRKIAGLPHGHLQPWPDMARMYEDASMDAVDVFDAPLYRIQPTFQIYTLGGVA